MTETLLQMLLCAIMISVVVRFVLTFQRKKEADEEMDGMMCDSGAMDCAASTTNSVPAMAVNKTSTRDLVFQTLRWIGCDIKEETNEGNSICFSYQGDTFLIDTWGNSVYIKLHFPFIFSFPANDIESFTTMQKAVNLMNFNGYFCFFYTINLDSGEAHVHIKHFMIFTADIRDYEKYLVSQLNEMFIMQRAFYTEIERLKVKEETV